MVNYVVQIELESALKSVATCMNSKVMHADIVYTDINLVILDISVRYGHCVQMLKSWATYAVRWKVRDQLELNGITFTCPRKENLNIPRFINEEKKKVYAGP